MTNTKTVLVSLLLLLALVSFIIRIAAVRRHRVLWLEEIDSRITPLALDEIVGAQGRETPRPVASAPRGDGDVYEAVPSAVGAPVEKETQLGSGIARARIDLERSLDSLTDAGDMGKPYFMRLAREMEDCRLKLRSPDPELRREGESICRRLARQMVEDRGSCNGAALEAMDRHMSAFADEVRETCLRRRFLPSPERSEFTRWAAGRMENGEKTVILFLIRLSGIVGDGGSVEAVGRCRRSDDPEIRRAAVWAMGMQGSPDVVDDVADILSDRSLPLSEGEAFLVALERIGDMRAAGVLCKVMCEAPPLLAYDAYLSLRELRDQASQPLSLEEFERGRGTVVAEYEAWLRNQNGRNL